ncbi:hypothetical protein ES332_D06G155500v1 [Gossypium tomentosum]|uniref:Uncharacterized protein n=1 Tax=Gossypium tomentosum TaxID=34277 RepID=A0A5D2KJL3_GOSTO|nr:hypothetical protein ES332_D06G155500v1 [Gossypium tomentosum]
MDYVFIWARAKMAYYTNYCGACTRLCKNDGNLFQLDIHVFSNFNEANLMKNMHPIVHIFLRVVWCIHLADCSCIHCQ